MSVRETLYGVEIHDPFRWLEETDDPQVPEWTAEQNAATRRALDGLPFRDRDRVRRRLDELVQVGRLEVPVVSAGRGTGKPRSKQLDAATDLWTFGSWQLGVEP